ncbi:MAG: Dps family protein [Treponema sp.]
MSKITENLAKHVADFGVMYVKIHNYHWHVSGVEFKVAHEMTESYYEEVTDAYDKVAERLLQLGATSPASFKEYLAMTGIKEETNHSFSIIEVATSLKADFEYILKELHETQKLAAESGDCTTDGIISGLIENFEKHVWMLSATLKK